MNAILTAKQKQEADSRNTSYAIWAAILIVANGEGVDADAIWQDGNIFQIDAVRSHVNDWVNCGLIDEGVFFWGDEKMEILSQSTVDAGMMKWEDQPSVSADRF